MGENKIWEFGLGSYTYSDLSGSFKYTEAGVPYNYAYEEIQPSVNQHSFRFFNNDGDEDESTPKASLNTSINLDGDSVFRLRFLVNTNIFTGQRAFKLKYRRKPSGGSFGPWETIV